MSEQTPNLANLITTTKNFLRELQEASNGKQTSLPFIIHELFSAPLAKAVFENKKLDGIFLGSTKGVRLDYLVGEKINWEFRVCKLR